VTAGPSHEPIDEVRVLANRSSGRLGLAVARAAERRGWPVTCLLGPVPPPEDPPSALLRFRTAAELETLLHRCWPDHDLLIMAAAVADFRPRTTLAGKMPRGAPLTLELEPVPDLLAGLGPITTPSQRRIGFALEEPRHLEARAAEKLRRKGIDAIVANPLDTLDSPGIRGVLLRRNGLLRTPPGAPDPIAKERFAEWLLDEALLLWSLPAPPHDAPTAPPATPPTAPPFPPH
jgi:phosphopantothenoylcysteine decarboxylase/phosphopantothenate--cysteine ligase